MHTTIPAVEVAHDRDPLGVRCPHGEAETRHAVQLHGLSAECPIRLVETALVEEIEVMRGQRGREGIRVVRDARIAGFFRL